MLEILFLYISFSIATGAVYYLFYFSEVLKENKDIFDSSFAFKFSMFLAASVLAPKVFIGILTLPPENIKAAILTSLLEYAKK